jgi:hypothetical protein
MAQSSSVSFNKNIQHITHDTKIGGNWLHVACKYLSVGADKLCVNHARVYPHHHSDEAGVYAALSIDRQQQIRVTLGSKMP